MGLKRSMLPRTTPLRRKGKASPKAKKAAGKRKKSRGAMKRSLDALCRLLVFERDGHQCIAKGFQHDCSGPLQWAHVHSRKYLATRWALDNGMTLCAAAHFLWHERPAIWVPWWLNWIGEERANALRVLLESGRAPKLNEVEEMLKAQGRAEMGRELALEGLEVSRPTQRIRGTQDDPMAVEQGGSVNLSGDDEGHDPAATGA